MKILNFFTWVTLINILILMAVCSMLSASRITEALLGLIFVFLGFIPLFIMLGFDFIAVTILIIYIGAVIIFFLFAIITINISTISIPELNKADIVIFLLVLTIFIYELINTNIFFFETLSCPSVLETYLISNSFFLHDININLMGNLIYTDYFSATIIISFILFLSMVGSMFLTSNLNQKFFK